MKFKHWLLLTCGLITSGLTHAQLQNVHVETYYISDANDATDTLGGYLAPGSVTYRVYLDLAPGSRVKSLYGDTDHRLRIASDQPFFNNKADGETFGKDFSLNRLSENTVALDTWLTIGMVTKASGKLHGILKSQDENGSLVGGSNNDGGSAGITTGLLSNADPLAGIPLTNSDGNDTLTPPGGSWFSYGILSTSGDDSTIFGSLTTDTAFISNNCGLLYSAGIHGTEPDSNLVLVAQLTTLGVLGFELNVEIIDSTGAVLKYVADNTVLNAGEIYNRKLRYPFEAICGCPDGNYLEYLADRDCDDNSDCQTLIRFGCMDPMACNYDPSANVNLDYLCCYPGRCSDRDLAVVCPQLEANRGLGETGFTVAPVPADHELTFTFSEEHETVTLNIFDALGKQLHTTVVPNGISSASLDVTGYAPGIYVAVTAGASESTRHKFIVR